MLSKLCGPCSWKLCGPGHGPMSLEEGCGIAVVSSGWSSMWMGRRLAARQRALPKPPDRPAPHRRLRGICEPGYTGGKRGEIVGTRTTVLQAHTHQWLGTFGGAGNGDYRGELRRAVAAIQRYLDAQGLPRESAIIRLDGQYGNGALVADLAEFAYVMRGRDYQLLDRPEVQARLHLPPDRASDPS